MKRFLVLGAALVLAMFATLAWAEEPLKARLDLTSEPNGVSVLVDGVSRGVTPLTVFDLTPGKHHVKFQLPDYEEEDKFVELDGRPVVDCHARLKPITGLLLIKTEPAGCHIKVDGISLGVSPRFISGLSVADTHTVRLSKPGYQEQTITVKLDGRIPMVREEKLVLDSGLVDFITDPAGAEVMVNGVVRGKTPLSVTGIPKGSAVVKLRLDGYREEVRELKLIAGERQTLSVPLTGLPGKLSLLSVPTGASFYINGEARGVAPISLANVAPGTYSVRCEKEGYDPLVKSITVANGQTVREEFRLANVMGRVEVRTVPAGVTVFIDGRKAGVTKSSSGAEDAPSDVLAIENVRAGEHAFVFRKDGYQDAARTVAVETQQTSRPQQVTLKRAFVPNVEVTTATEVIRGVFKYQNENSIVVERKPGLEYPIPRQFVRKVEYLVGK